MQVCVNDVKQTLMFIAGVHAYVGVSCQHQDSFWFHWAVHMGMWTVSEYRCADVGKHNSTDCGTPCPQIHTAWAAQAWYWQRLSCSCQAQALPILQPCCSQNLLHQIYTFEVEGLSQH